MSEYLKLSLLTATAFSSPAFAETVDFDDIVVTTATRTAVNKANVGASISVLTPEALERGQYSFALDAIQGLPGVTINQNGGFGTQASVSIRGNSTAQTVVLIDGVQVNDVSSPAGAFDFGKIDPATIERIEVLRGPQSVLYGSDAIGGVVSIITKGHTGEGFSGNAFGEYGAYDSVRGGATLNGGSDRIGFTLSGSYTDTDGISVAEGGEEKDGHENLTLRARINATLTDGLRAEVFGSYSDSDTDVDAFGPIDSGVDKALSKEYTLGGRLFIDLLDGKFANTLSLDYSEIDRASVSAFGTFPGKGERLNADYLGVYTFDDNWSLTAGAQHESYKASTASTERVYINSVFGMLSYASDGLNLSGGVRTDDHEQFGSTTSGQFRASYQFADTGTRLFANWGQGFKAPSLYQQTYICGFCGLTEPNYNLLPERSNAWEIGVEQTVLEGDLLLSATYFDQRTKNLIDFSFTAGYDNIARTRSRGLELGLEWLVNDSLSLAANYTYTDAEDRDTGITLIRRPKHQAFGQVNYDVTEAFSTQLRFTYNGTEQDSAAEVPSWVRVDLTASYRLNETLELYGRINNLFDEDYQQVLGYATTGINSTFGLRASF